MCFSAFLIHVVLNALFLSQSYDVLFEQEYKVVFDMVIPVQLRMSHL